MSLSADLYSADISSRYAASLRYESEHPGIVDTWPRGCWGAANGWLMLCGPSPGKKDTADNIWSGEPGRPIDEKVRIGHDAGRINLAANRARNARWRKLASSACGSEDIANCLTAVANLDWRHYPDHRKIPQDYLRDGCHTVLEIMRKSKPRVVITLVKITWNYLSDYLDQFCVSEALTSDEYSLQVRIVHLPECLHKTLLLKSPQHPSRPFFTDAHCLAIEKTVERFLDEYL